MLTLVTKTIRKNLLQLLIYTGISSAFVWMYVAFYPSIAKESEALRTSFEAFPQEIFQAFDIDIDTFISSFEGFISSEYYGIIWPIILFILIISYASAAIAGEIDKGTIDLLLAQPLSRLKIFISKYLSGMLLVIAFILLTNFSVVPFATLHNVDYQLQNYLTMSVISFLFAFAVFSICMMVSSMSSSRGRPAAITGGLLIIMYALDIFSAFEESVEFLKYFSFFHYFDVIAAVVHNQIDTMNILIFSVVGIVATIAALLIFLNRDISTN